MIVSLLPSQSVLIHSKSLEKFIKCWINFKHYTNIKKYNAILKECYRPNEIECTYFIQTNITRKKDNQKCLVKWNHEYFMYVFFFPSFFLPLLYLTSHLFYFIFLFLFLSFLLIRSSLLFSYLFFAFCFFSFIFLFSFLFFSFFLFNSFDLFSSPE